MALDTLPPGPTSLAMRLLSFANALTMKLATYKDGSRDGQLVVVSRDLATACYTTGIAFRLQQVFDDWDFMSPQLQDAYDALNAGRARHAFPFDPVQCMAPLPRACQWACGCAQPNHVEPAAESDRPALSIRRGASDDFAGPCDPILVASDTFDIGFGPGIAVITGDVRRGATTDQALDAVRLVLLVNDVSLGKPVHAELATAFSPVAVTPDELGTAWRGGRLHLTLQSILNGRKVGQHDAGDGMTFHFGQLIAHMTRSRNVRAGSIIGSGAVGNQGAELMTSGDTIRIEMKGLDGRSMFGAIEQEVTADANHQPTP